MKSWTPFSGMTGRSLSLRHIYPDGWGEAAPLTGLLYCADCGGKMYVHRTNNVKRMSQYSCSQYSKVPVGKLCTTQHRINEDVVLSLVSEMLKAIAEYAKDVYKRQQILTVTVGFPARERGEEYRRNRTEYGRAHRDRRSKGSLHPCR